MCLINKTWVENLFLYQQGNPLRLTFKKKKQVTLLGRAISSDIPVTCALCGHQSLRSALEFSTYRDRCVFSGWSRYDLWPSFQVEMVVRLWKDGFTVNDEEFRSYSIPENQDFLDAIKRGWVKLPEPEFVKRLLHVYWVRFCNLKARKDYNILSSDGVVDWYRWLHLNMRWDFWLLIAHLLAWNDLISSSHIVKRCVRRSDIAKHIIPQPIKSKC